MVKIRVYFSPMPQALKQYITIDNDILGGTPVIRGTRIPIVRLSELVKQGYSANDLTEAYPHVEAKKIHFLIAYLMEAGLDAFTHQTPKK